MLINASKISLQFMVPKIHRQKIILHKKSYVGGYIIFNRAYLKYKTILKMFLHIFLGKIMIQPI